MGSEDSRGPENNEAESLAKACNSTCWQIPANKQTKKENEKREVRMRTRKKFSA